MPAGVREVTLLLAALEMSLPLLHSLVSRDGYVVVDDTHHPHFDDSPWPWVANTTYPQPNPSECTPIPPEQVGGRAVIGPGRYELCLELFRESTVAFQE